MQVIEAQCLLVLAPHDHLHQAESDARRGCSGWPASGGGVRSAYPDRSLRKSTRDERAPTASHRDPALFTQERPGPSRPSSALSRIPATVDYGADVPPYQQVAAIIVATHQVWHANAQARSGNRAPQGLVDRAVGRVGPVVDVLAVHRHPNGAFCPETRVVAVPSASGASCWPLPRPGRTRCPSQTPPPTGECCWPQCQARTANPPLAALLAYGPTATSWANWPVKRACGPLPLRVAWLTVSA